MYNKKVRYTFKWLIINNAFKQITKGGKQTFAGQEQEMKKNKKMKKK